MRLRLPDVLFFVSFLCFSTSLNAQVRGQEKIDSLKNVAEQATGPKRIDAFFTLFIATVKVDRIAAEKIVDQALAEADFQTYNKGMVRARLIKAGLRIRQRSFDDALLFLKAAEEINEGNEEKFFEADLKGALGNLYTSRQEMDKALESYLAVLKLSEFTHKKSFRAGTMFSIANIYVKFGKKDEAIDYLNQALKLLEEDGNEYTQGDIYSTLGTIESRRMNIGQAVDYLKKAESIYRKYNAKESLSSVLLNLGVVYMNVNRLTEAIACFDEAMPVYVRLQNHSSISLLLLNKARVRIKQDKEHLAVPLIEKSLVEAELAKDIEMRAGGYQLLYLVYESSGNYKSALERFKMYTQLKDSLAQRRNRVKVESIMAEYEFEKKENELKASEESLESARNEQELSESRQLILVIAMALLIGIIALLIFSYRSYMARAKLKQDYLSEKTRNTELSKESLHKELALKDSALKGYLERIQQKNDLISSIEDKLTNLEKEGAAGLNNENISELALSVKRKVIRSITWEEFRLKFDEVHQQFVPSLASKHAELTNNELDICVLLKINLANKEIAQTLNMSYDSVKKSLQRLYRKLGLSSNEELRMHIVKF